VVLHGPERPTVLTVNSTGRLVGLGPS
jgi:hypothetical protein